MQITDWGEGMRIIIILLFANSKPKCGKNHKELAGAYSLQSLDALQCELMSAISAIDTESAHLQITHLF